MVGKRRLNQRLGRDTRRRAPGLRSRCDGSPLFCSAGNPSVEDPPVELFNSVGLKREANLEPLNHSRNEATSMGRRSDCQSRKTPPTRKTRSASQTPAGGDRRPWRAKETPINEIE